MQKSLYRDYDALAYNPKHVGEERGAINFIKKTKQRQKGVEIVFDPKAHKEFVTGFRKRKQQRRKEAEKQILKKSKQQRLQDRAERRKELKHQLGLPDDYGVQDSDSEQGAAADPAAAAAKADVKQYQQGAYTTVVSVTNLNMGDSDDEQQQQSGEDSGSEDEPQQQQQRRGKPTSGGSKANGSLNPSKGKVQKGSKSNKSHKNKKKRKQKK